MGRPLTFALRVLAYYQRDGNDQDTVVAEFPSVSVEHKSDSSRWVARDAAGTVVAEMTTFDDEPVLAAPDEITVEGVLRYPRGTPHDGSSEHYGAWKLGRDLTQERT